MKQFISLIVCAILVTMCFAACGDGSGNTSSAASEAASSAASQAESLPAESDEPIDPLSHIEQQDMGRKIVFLVIGDEQDRYRSVEIMPNDFSPDLISSAVAERNHKVEERLGITISEERCDGGSMATVIRSNSMADTPDYDIVMPYLYQAAALTTEKVFLDLNDYSDILKLDEAYWNPTAQKSLSIGNKLYFATGDFSLLSFECTHAMVFNKTLLGKLGLESPYALVESGDWTLDKLVEMSKAATADTDGESGITYKDTVGFWVDADFMLSMFMASGERMSSKDTSDYPIMTLGTERAATVISRLSEIITDPTCSLHIEKIHERVIAEGYKDCYYYATQAFAEGRALFRSLSLVDLHELSDFEVDYGILPAPKYNSEQENYYCYGSTTTVTAAAIPTSAKDPEQLALVLEAIAAASETTVRYSYYEVLLKSRKIVDEDGEAALDTIFANRVYDLADIYNWGSVREMMFNVLSNANGNFASTWESRSDSINAAMDNTIDYFKE